MVAAGAGRVAQAQQDSWEAGREAAGLSVPWPGRCAETPALEAVFLPTFCLLRTFFSQLKLILASGWKGYIPNLEGLVCVWNINQSVCMCCCK